MEGFSGPDQEKDLSMEGEPTFKYTFFDRSEKPIKKVFECSADNDAEAFGLYFKDCEEKGQAPIDREKFGFNRLEN